MVRDSTSSWSWASRVMHWLSALAVCILFALGWWMVDLNYYSQWYKTAPHWHKSLGLLLALLTLVRLVWRWLHPGPRMRGTPWERRLAGVVHALLYLLLVALFISGYLISTADGRGIDLFTWFTLPSLGALVEQQEEVAGDIHKWLAYGLIGLALLHAMAALKHHFVDKDQTLVRMLLNTKS